LTIFDLCITMRVQPGGKYNPKCPTPKGWLQ